MTVRVVSEPFFLVGPVRSGTTLLRLMLGHHPEICRCEEMDFVTPFLAHRPDGVPIDEYLHELSVDRGFGLSGYEIDSRLNFMDLAQSFLEQRQRVDGRRLVGATVHHHFSLLPKIWSNARFVLVNRDPRDVTRSCMAMGWGGTAWHAARIWCDAQAEWERLKSLIPAERLHEIRFDELVNDPDRVLSDLTLFLGVSYSSFMQDIEKDTTYRRPSPSEAQSWRTKASAREIREVEARVGPAQILKAGYPLSGLPSLPLNLRTRMEIATADVVRRVTFRIDRYGFRLWLAGVISRRLPLRGLSDSIRLKINEVDNQYLK